jgi:hypothetical protein
VPRDDARLELLRAASGLAVDGEGRFLHRGEPITHARTLEVLWRSLARGEDGRYRVTIGREVAYVDVGETPWVVRGLLLEGPSPPVLLLAGGGREPLDPSTLSVGADGVLRCRVRGGERARFARSAQVALGLSLEEDPAGAGGYLLRLSGVCWKVRGEPPP